MTFTDLVVDVMDRLNLTSAAATTRVGKAVNRAYKQVTSTLGLVTARRVEVSTAATISSQYITFSGIEKIIAVIDKSTGQNVLLTELTVEEIQNSTLGIHEPPRSYAIYRMGASSVTIRLDSIAQTAYTLYAEGHETAGTLSGVQVPAFPESYHDVLSEAVLVDEYRKLGQTELMKASKSIYEQRISDLRFWIAKSTYLDIYQGKTAREVTGLSGGSGSGGVITGGQSYTQTGLITFDREPSAPFAVSPGSAKVDNLDVDLLDGQTSADYHNAGLLTGVYAALVGTAITALNASNLSSGTVAIARLGAGVTTRVLSTATGAQHNWAPGISGDTYIQWTGTSDLAVTGFAGGTTGMRLTFRNAGTKIATFAHVSGSSTATNRLAVTNGTTLYVPPAQTVTFIYDSGLGYWVDQQPPRSARGPLHAEDFGCIGDDSFDNSTAFANWFTAIFADSTREGKIGAGIFRTTTALPSITISGVKITGVGSPSSHDVGAVYGTNLTQTIIKQQSGAVTMLTIAPPTGASAQRLDGVHLQSIGFDCNGVATVGVLIQSVFNGTFDFAVFNALTTGFQLGVVATLGEARDCQRNIIRYTGRQAEAGGVSGVSLRLTGDATANTSFNIFERVSILHTNAAAIVCENSDSNTWRYVYCLEAGAATESVILEGSNTSAALTARNEEFHFLSTNLPLLARGTTTYTHPSTFNRISVLDKGNGTPDPTIETGAILYWSNQTTPIYDGVWRTYTPTIAAATGTFTTVSATGRYQRRANSIRVQIVISITTNGSAATNTSATLPFTAAAVVSILNGREVALVGTALQGYIASGASTVTIVNSASTYVGGDGAILVVNGEYEV